MFTIKAPTYQAQKRASIDITAVVDVSGSMEGDKLDLVKESLKFVVGQLADSDSLGIVTYDHEVYHPFPQRKLDQAGRETALKEISKIKSGGSTNLSGGLLAGIDMLRRYQNKNEVSSILLMTDGLANVGITDRQGIIRAMLGGKVHESQAAGGAYPPFPVQQANSPVFLANPCNPPAFPVQQQQQQQQAVLPPIQQLLQTSQPGMQAPNQSVNPFAQPNAPANPFAQMPNPAPNPYVQMAQMPQMQMMQQQRAPPTSNVDPPGPDAPALPGTVYTLGFGTDHDSALLKAIAEAGHGVYYFLKDAETIPQAFGDVLGGLLSVVAQNLSLKVTAAEGCKISAVMTKFRVSAVREGLEYDVAVKDVQSDERKDILVEVDIPALPQPAANVPILNAELRYFSVISSSQEVARASLTIDRPERVDNPVINLEIDIQMNRHSVTTALESGMELAKSDLKAARKTLQDAIDRLKQSHSKDDPRVVNLLKDLSDALDGMKDERTYDSVGSKNMAGYYSSHAQQRANIQTISSYATPMRYEMQSKSAGYKK